VNQIGIFFASFFGRLGPLMRFLTFIRHNLFRQKVRSLLTSLGVAVSITAVVALVSTSSGFKNALSSSFVANGIDMVVVRAGLSDTSTSSLPESSADRLRALPGVGRVEPYLTEAITEQGAGVMGVTFKGLTPDSELLKNLKIVDGERLKSGDQKSVMVGKSLSQSLGKKVGDSLQLEQETFKVVGVFDASNVLDNGQAIVFLADLQKVLDRPAQVTGFQIVLAKELPDKEDTQKTVTRLREQIRDLKDESGSKFLSALPTKDFVSSDMQIRLAGAMAWGTSLIALVIGTIGILNTMVMSVLERTREIGILRAIGWRKSRVMGMILLESLLLSMLGWVMGVAGAFVLTVLLAEHPRAKNFVRYEISPTVIAVGFVVSLLVALVGGAYPAFRGANLKPTEALHYE
jgi:putative ABC transport system permease protein